MNLTRKILSLILVIGIAASCSKDDEKEDPQPSLENVSLSLAESTTVVSVPSAMASSNDPYAMQANAYVQQANAIGSSLAMFKAPANATKSTTEITAENGRAQASASVLVYTWSDAKYGTVAYQVKDAGTKYSFEFLIQAQGETKWYRYLYAEELKDHSAGKMEVYDLFLGTDGILAHWDWTKSGDNFDFNMTSDLGGDLFKVNLQVNTKTRAGSVVYYEGTDKLYDMTWDAKGNGSWNFYDEGKVIASGTWTA